MKTIIMLMCSTMFVACCPYPEHCDAVVRGTCVVGEIDDNTVAALDFAIQNGLDYWQVPESILNGYVIVLEGQFATCNDQTGYSGCCDGDCKEIRLGYARGCFEFSLAHEIGHVVIDDNQHADARWCEVPSECFAGPPAWGYPASPYCS